MANATGFDSNQVEMEIEDFFTEKLGGTYRVFESRVPGVVAFEEPMPMDYDKFSFNELAARLKKATGIDVLVVARCDWTMTYAAPDEEAILVAFDVPELPEDYRSDCRNYIDRDEVERLVAELQSAPSV
jgi:hypothetical protein